MKNLFFLAIFLYVCFKSQAQSTNSSFLSTEIELSRILKEIKQTKNDSLKILLNEKIIFSLDTLLTQRESFDYPFDSLFMMGRLRTIDGKIRIYNWNISLNNGKYKYYCFLQCIKKNNKIQLFKLTDNTDSLVNPKQAMLGKDEWFGALYYEIIINKLEKKSFYTLLGLKLNDDFTTKKVIDVLSFGKNGDPVFGKDIFDSPGEQLQTRIIFEYSARVVMKLNFDEARSIIVFDHLSPSNISYTGFYQFYGPDLSYDGFKYENGRWVYMKDIDVRNPKK